MKEALYRAIDAQKSVILEAVTELNKIPELGFQEWKTHAYLKKAFENFGYILTEPGDIPGFYVDVDTGKPGPCIAVFGELDAIPVNGHPDADPETGAAHACGHHLQCAALLSVAIALKVPGALMVFAVKSV